VNVCGLGKRDCEREEEGELHVVAPTDSLPVTPQNRYPKDSSDPAESRTISILRRPPTQRARRSTHVMPEELTRAVTLQQDYNRAHKKLIYYNNDSNESRYKHTRSESYRRSNTSEYEQDINWTKSPEDNQWRP
jgi:hypothetical protein